MVVVPVANQQQLLLLKTGYVLMLTWLLLTHLVPVLVSLMLIVPIPVKSVVLTVVEVVNVHQYQQPQMLNVNRALSSLSLLQGSVLMVLSAVLITNSWRESAE
jgi:hypothetical protein